MSTRVTILAIDPGPEVSAWVRYDPSARCILECGRHANEPDVRALVGWCVDGLLAVEMVASYGMPVGRDVFETVLWTGRFVERWGPNPYRLVYRSEVKTHLCRNQRAKDSNIRQALLDLFPRTGGGATPQVGTKKQPGPLYGVSRDIWSALAVAVTAAEPLVNGRRAG